MFIRLRFTLALTGVGVALFGAYALWAYRGERQDLRASATAELRLVGQSLVTSLGNALRDKQPADVDETLATLEALTPGLEIHLHDPAGRALAHSRGAAQDERVEQLAAQAATAATAAPATNRGEQVLTDPPDTSRIPRRIIFWGPLTSDDGAVLGSLVVARLTQDLTSDLERTRNRLLLALLSFAAATVAIGLVLGTLYVSRPIARLLDGVRHVRAGDFRSPVRMERRDEIGALVAEFNAMIDALSHSRERIEEAAEVRSRLELGLQRVDKLVTIGQLSAGLAHEIGSPLQVLSGRASALLDHGDAEVRRQAGLLVGQCDRITRVVEQLLSVGRRKPAAVGPCDLGEPVTAVLDLLAGDARRAGVALELERDDGPHLIVGDRDQLQQVTLNIVRNALQATAPGGAITVRVDRTIDRAIESSIDRAVESSVDRAIAAAPARVRLSVRDDGRGMDEATRGRLFEPFFTTRAADGGTGLGLAVVQAIASEHRATLEVQSQLGHGAEFVVSFPEAPRA